jgi:hypothetical protein
MVSLANRSKPLNVAILTYRDKSRVFRGNRDNFIDLLRTAREEGVNAYIIAQDSLDPNQRGFVKGFTYHPKKKTWVRVDQPFPQVVYNRIPYRKFEQLPEVQSLIQGIMKQPDMRLFNPAFFSKWSLFEWLNAVRSTRKHIPDTVKLNGPVDLAKFIRNHRTVYLKPIKGKAGKGIMKVQRTTKGYRLISPSAGGVTTSTYDSITKLYDEAKKHFGQHEYIAQQGISLVKSGGRPFDLRALVQKDAQGIWRISGVGARVAGESSITTHVPRGGSIDNPVKLLTHAFGATEGKAILHGAKTTALSLASQIEKGSGVTLGEMSMDLGVDKSGKLWFFEANSKPMKFDEPHIRKLSLRRLIRYWKFLHDYPQIRMKRRNRHAR